MTDRIACAVVPALPLQMLLRRRREGDDGPVAVVDRDSPTGRVLWASPAAIRGGVLPGLRYAAALALCRDLRAGEVPAPEIRAEVARLAALLRRHSPAVEPSEGEPGVFWLGVRGLVPLYASLAAWREETLAALRAEKYVARAAVGFTRFGAFAAARAGREPGVFGGPESEREAALAAPLRLLGLPHDDRDALERLGVFRVRDLLALPAAGVGSRFGPETARLRRLAAGDLPDPLEPVPGEEPIRAREILEHAETDAARLLLLLDRLLAPLAERLAERDRAAAAVAVRLALDDGGTALLEVRPAAPTRDAAHLSQLLRLRLEATRLASGVVEAAIEIRAAPPDPGERRLFADRDCRDAAAAGRALARVRAEFGPGAAARARLRDAHLPEASFEWAPIEGALPPPRPRFPRGRAAQGPQGRAAQGQPDNSPGAPDNSPGAPDKPPGAPPRRSLVRRLLLRPLPIASPESARHADGGWSPGGLRAGAAVPGAGPFAVSGGWWAREVRREYHWLETRRGDVLWAFHDRVRRRWFLQGRVE